MPDPRRANPAGSISIARKQFALPLETPPHGVGTVIEKNGAPRESVDETAEIRKVVLPPQTA